MDIDREFHKIGLRLSSSEPERECEHVSKWGSFILCTSECETIGNVQRHI